MKFPMSGSTFLAYAFLITCCLLRTGTAAGSPEAGVTEILSKNCFRCHGEKDKVEGKVDLGPLIENGDFAKDLELLDEKYSKYSK